MSGVIVADCLIAMSMLTAESVDAIVTDPPYHLTQASRGGSARVPGTGPFGRHRVGSKGFMGKTWDGGGVAFRVELWEVALRLLKPGARLLAFGGTRTYHRMACAIEDAGFEVEDSLCWLYGSGFPKHDSKLKPAFEPIVNKRHADAETTWRNSKGNRRGNSFRGPGKPVCRGPANGRWKGDGALTQSKRLRAQKAYEMGTCERCQAAPATDRHHKDGNTGHNERENIALLCRRCHMVVDGRLDALRSLPRPKKIGDRPCSNCGGMTPILNKGRCRRCAAYIWRFKKERPAHLFAKVTA